MDIFLETITLTIGALLPIMNPFSTAPLFCTLTAKFDRKRQRQQALMACVYAFGILVVFLWLGSVIVEFFSISVPGIRVAGGLIIATVGFRMLFPAPPSAGSVAADPTHDIAFTPIAMPSLAGPGSIAVVLGAAAQIQSLFPDYWAVIYLAVVVGMVITLAITFAVLCAAGEMVRVLGPSGIDAMTRIFGFLLVCIAMQFLLTGIADFYGITRA
ncbi:MAG TPA: MarC family NAAT transporter [Croceibacterium sp.]|nr:MarC family NAAT transporter [Croceibacterium sp.]